jgi:atypical dual specificity phosphatase
MGTTHKQQGVGITAPRPPPPPNGNDDDDDNDEGTSPELSSQNQSPWWLTTTSYLRREFPPVSSSIIFSTMPNVASMIVRSTVVATVALYILNQKHYLPMPLSRVVSKALFWPTIPITISRRIGKWTTVVDDSVLIGGAPFGNYPYKLSKQFNVKGVVNMCDEYSGPVTSYERLGIEQLRLPTVDHFEPSVEDLKLAVAFIQRHEQNGDRVYVHCKAGHGRSAAAVYAWLLYKEPLADPIELNEKLCSMRNVRKTLWKQPNINVFREWLRNGGMMSDSDGEDDYTLYRDGNSAHKYHLGGIKDIDDDKEFNNRNVVVRTKLGQVFNDEDSEMYDDSSEEVDDESLIQDLARAYDEISVNERNVNNWGEL